MGAAVFAPGWAAPEEAAAGVGEGPETGVAFAPGWPSPADLAPER